MGRAADRQGHLQQVRRQLPRRKEGYTLMPFLLALLPVWNVFKAILAWLVTFLSRPPGVYLLAAALICLAVWWSGERGYKRGQVACQASHQAAAAREVHRQTMVFQTVGDRSEARTAK